MSFKCHFLDPHLTTYYSNLGLHIIDVFNLVPVVIECIEATLNLTVQLVERHKTASYHILIYRRNLSLVVFYRKHSNTKCNSM